MTQPTSHRILIVDDNEDSAEALAEILCSRGHDARAVFDGNSALAMADVVHPELALVDLCLPDMDGVELADRLRRLPGLDAIKLVALTGYSPSSGRADMLAGGFHEHVTKPPDFDRLSQIIARLLAGSPSSAD